jgi:hypothetical protein
VSNKKKELFILQQQLCSSPVCGGVRVVTYKSNTRASYKKQELFILQELLCSFPGFGGVRVVTYISNTASKVSTVPASYKTLAVLLIYVTTWTQPQTGDEHRST